MPSARITISYREDIDRVVEILHGVGDQLAQDEALQPSFWIRSSIWGSTPSTTSSVALDGAHPHLTGKQWAVGPRLQPPGQNRLRRARDRLARPDPDRHAERSGGVPTNSAAAQRRGTAAPARLKPQSRSPRASASTASISAQASTASATRRLKPARANAPSSRAWSAAARRNGPRRRRRANTQAAARSRSGASARRPDTASAIAAAATPFAASRARIARVELAAAVQRLHPRGGVRRVVEQS